MAHEFLGTFNKAMYDRLRTFIQSQLPFIQDRISHLAAEKNRIGVIQFRYTKGIPVGYVSDPNSYLGKLLAAYEVLGGNPGVDLRIRLSTDPIFVVAGDENTPPSQMSNGEAIGSRGLSDADSGDLVRLLRTAFDSTISRRFDYLERKIRRATDYADQLQAEMDQLSVLVAAAEVDGSLENTFAQVEQLLADPTYRAISPDTSEHAELGQNVRAPYSAYDVPEGALQDPNIEVSREAITTQRQSGNLPPVKPGQSSA
jgi:hypothetical protein